MKAIEAKELKSALEEASREITSPRVTPQQTWNPHRLRCLLRGNPSQFNPSKFGILCSAALKEFSSPTASQARIGVHTTAGATSHKEGKAGEFWVLLEIWGVPMGDPVAALTDPKVDSLDGYKLLEVSSYS